LALEHSVVYRQLAGKSRFSRIDFGDILFGLLPWALHTTVGTFAGWAAWRPYLTLVTSIAALVVLRLWVPEGLGPLFYMVNTPHQLSAFGRDRLIRYPPAAPRPNPARSTR
jgi:hypothetical protein